MSGLSDFTKAYNSVSDENNKIGPLIEAELKYLAALTGVQGLPEGVEFVALMIGVNDGVNQAMANMLAALDQKLSLIFTVDRVQAVLDRLQSIDRVTAGAQTALDQLKADLTASPPVTFEYRQQQIAKCLDALNEFDNDDQWKVNYFNQIYYSDPWSGTIAPAPDATGLAFSTIFILPVFLRTIIQFLTVGIAFEPNFVTAYGDPIRRFAGRLQTVYETARQGIVTLRAPAPNELYEATTDDTGASLYIVFNGALVNVWAEAGSLPTAVVPNPEYAQPYGAVDLYGARVAVANYPPLPPPGDGPPLPQNFLAPFFASLSLANLLRSKQVYVGLGLSTTRIVINALKSLTGDQILEGRDPGDISFREIQGVLGLSDDFFVFERLVQHANVPPNRPLSVRTALAAIPSTGWLPPPSP